MNGNKDKEANKIPKVEWLGIDGALVLLYFILAGVYTYGIIGRVDFIVGIMAPVIACGITVLVFLRYCVEVVGFMKKTKGDK